MRAVGGGVPEGSRAMDHFILFPPLPWWTGRPGARKPPPQTPAACPLGPSTLTSPCSTVSPHNTARKSPSRARGKACTGESLHVGRRARTPRQGPPHRPAPRIGAWHASLRMACTTLTSQTVDQLVKLRRAALQALQPFGGLLSLLLQALQVLRIWGGRIVLVGVGDGGRWRGVVKFWSRGEQGMGGGDRGVSVQGGAASGACAPGGVERGVEPKRRSRMWAQTPSQSRLGTGWHLRGRFPGDPRPQGQRARPWYTSLNPVLNPLPRQNPNAPANSAPSCRSGRAQTSASR